MAKGKASSAHPRHAMGASLASYGMGEHAQNTMRPFNCNSELKLAPLINCALGGNIAAEVELGMHSAVRDNVRAQHVVRAHSLD